MPQPPGPQPAPFTTPNPSRFRLPRRPDQTGPASLDSEGQGLPGATATVTTAVTTPAGRHANPGTSAVRPTPRFAPSWRRPATAQKPPASQSQHVRTPVSAARQFSTLSTSTSRAHHHPRWNSLDDSLVFQAADVIEDGSSPPVENIDAALEATPSDESTLVVRESPTATRTLAESTPISVPNKKLWKLPSSKGPLRYQNLREDIEDVTANSSEGELDNGSGIGARPEEVPEVIDVVEDSGEMPMADLVDRPTIATPRIEPFSFQHQELPGQGGQQQHRQNRSASRLLSSVQPFKRRRLFVSPGLIHSSPGYSENEEDGDSSEDNEKREDSLFDNGTTRTDQWGEDIVDDESDDDHDDGNRALDYQEMCDIVKYGELLEFADSDNEDRDAESDDEKDDDYTSHHEVENEDEVDYDKDEEDDDYMILDRTPTRIRRARQQQHQPITVEQQRQRLPTFQRARLFMSAKKTTDEQDELGLVDRNNPSETGLPADVAEAAEAAEVTTNTPAWKHHATYDAPQPPADFFSPQKKRRRPTKRQKQEDSINQAGSGSRGETGVSPAAAAAAAPEQYVPGGLAAELRDWLVQIKSGSGIRGDKNTGPGSLFSVDNVRTAPGLSLALGYQSQTARPKSNHNDETSKPAVHLLLAGEGKQQGAGRVAGRRVRQPDLQKAKKIGNGAAVSLAPPIWEVTLGGQPWMVASDWSVGEGG